LQQKKACCQTPDYLKDTYIGSPLAVDVAINKKKGPGWLFVDFEQASPSIGSYYFVTR
jgi:hypothetical protein